MSYDLNLYFTGVHGLLFDMQTSVRRKSLIISSLIGNDVLIVENLDDMRELNGKRGYVWPSY